MSSFWVGSYFLGFLGLGPYCHFTQKPKRPTSSEVAKQLNSEEGLTKNEMFIFESRDKFLLSSRDFLLSSSCGPKHSSAFYL